MIIAKGVSGSKVTFDGSFVEISKRGMMAVAGGGGSKRIPVRAITAVQIKKPGVLVRGFIQFTIAGGNEVRARFGHQAFDAAADENSVIFTKKQMNQFVELRTAIEQTMVLA